MSTDKNTKNTKNTENTEKTEKKSKRGVGTVAIEAIMDGKTNEEALAACRKAFPDAKTSLASINWYRNKLRVEGKKVSTARELTKKTATKKPAKKGATKDPLE